jgi:uncharacterized protein YlxW (UPF0749 family)
MDIKKKPVNPVVSMAQKVQELTLLVIKYRKEIDDERAKIQADIRQLQEMIERLNQK